MQGCRSTIVVVGLSIVRGPVYNLSLWLLFPCYVSLTISLWTTSQKPGQSPYSFALSLFSLSKKTKSPSNKGKMNQTVGWETVRWESTQPMRVRRDGGKVRVNSKQLQTVWHLGECETERIWKETGWFLWAWWVWCLWLCSASKPLMLLLSCQMNNTNKSR